MRLKNLLFQPLTLNLSLDANGLHLNARETADILESHISDEIRKAEERGLIAFVGAVDAGVGNSLDFSKKPITSNDSEPIDIQKKASIK